MAHGRTQIRQAIGTALASLVTPVTVEIESRRRLTQDDMPAVLVGMDSDTAETDQRSMGAWTVERQQTVRVELHAYGSNSVAMSDTVDQMELEVEAALAADPFLGGIAELVEFMESEVEWSADQEVMLLTRSVTYRVTWRHDFGAPDIPEG